MYDCVHGVCLVPIETEDARCLDQELQIVVSPCGHWEWNLGPLQPWAFNSVPLIHLFSGSLLQNVFPKEDMNNVYPSL